MKRIGKSELHEIVSNDQKFKKLFALLVPITEFVLSSQMVRCPFHDDKTPSARVYPADEDGVSRLFCFSCRRQFTSWDYVTKILDRKPIDYARENYTEDQLLIVANKVDFEYRKTELQFEKEQLESVFKSFGVLGLMRVVYLREE